jgi:uncharacterized membrane protein
MGVFPLQKAIEYGWNTMKKHLWFFVCVTLLVLVISIPISLLISQLQKSPDILFFVAILQIANIFLTSWLALGLIKIYLHISGTDTAHVTDLFSCGHYLWRYFIANLVVFLLVLFGFFLLIIPGVILALRLQFVNYLIIDEDLGALTAIDRSWALTRGHTLNLLVFYLLNALISILGFTCLIVGLFAAVPTVAMATTYLYQWLKKQPDHVEEPAAALVA